VRWSPTDDPLEFLSHRSHRQTSHRVAFALETTIAAAHNEALQMTVGDYLTDPDKRVSQLDGFDDAQKSLVSGFVHSGAALTNGTQWMSGVTATEMLDFEEFSELFRISLLNEWRKAK
jgi:hypothetical protein